jgi:hypothetical protein
LHETRSTNSATLPESTLPRNFESIDSARYKVH